MVESRASNWSIRFTHLFVFLMCYLIHSSSTGQQPFVQYSERDSAYLSRLHRQIRGPLSVEQISGRGVRRWQVIARRKLTELLGLDVIARANRGYQSRVRLQDSIADDGFSRTLGKIETEAGIEIPFWLLIPNGKQQQPRPLAICAQGHGGNSWNNYAGIYQNAAERDKALARNATPGLESVRRGYITIVPAVRGLSTVTSIADPKGRHGNQLCRAQLIHCLLVGRTAIGERVWDCQKILDWALTALPNVDAKRVLFTGNSGGGVLSVYMAALDERIAVAVPSCSFTSYTDDSGFVFHCDCCLVPRVQSELGDFSDIGALVVPRYLLAVHGKQDGLHHYPAVEAAMARVARVYDRLDQEGRFAHRWGEQGHKFYPDLMWPFIENAFAEIDK